MKVRVIWKPGSTRNRSGDAEVLVDTCAHILWGVDDGPNGLEPKRRHASAASRANFEYPFDPEVIAQRTDEIREQCDNSIRIHTGRALHFGLGNIRDALANLSTPML